jgi:DNA-binding transcriptional MerR regulator
MPKSPDAFRTISEVADWLDTPAHVLRFWESKFTQVKPVKRAGGRRYYRPADMDLLGGIKHLLHDDGMTIKGVQKVLREKGVKHVAGLTEHSALTEETHSGAEHAIIQDAPFAEIHEDGAQTDVNSESVIAFPDPPSDPAQATVAEDAIDEHKASPPVQPGPVQREPLIRDLFDTIGSQTEDDSVIEAVAEPQPDPVGAAESPEEPTEPAPQDAHEGQSDSAEVDAPEQDSGTAAELTTETAPEPPEETDVSVVSTAADTPVQSDETPTACALISWPERGPLPQIAQVKSIAPSHQQEVADLLERLRAHIDALSA